jgi:hypothetical protein
MLLLTLYSMIGDKNLEQRLQRDIAIGQMRSHKSKSKKKNIKNPVGGVRRPAVPTCTA